MSTKSPYTGREMSTLGNVATYINGRAFKPSEWENRGLPIIRIQNLTNPSAPYNYSSSELEEKYKVRKGDLLFAWSASLGAHIWKGNDAWLNQHIFRVVPSEKIEKKYLYYFLLQVVAELYAKTHGSGMVHITKGPFMNTPIPVPSLPEQKRIVSKIEELFSKLDASVAELQTAKEKLKVYRQAVLKKVFSSIRNYVPFGNITDARLGKMLDKEKNTGTPQRYLRNINVRWFQFDLSDLLEMRIGLDEIEKYSIQYGDLVICEGGEPGRCAVWEEQKSIFYQKALHRVRFTDGSNPKFYMYYLWFAAQTGQLKNFFTGSGIKHLTGQSLAKVPVPNPDKNTQDYAVSEIEFRLSVCDNIEQTIEASLQQAEALRQSILKQAFEGEQQNDGND